ncbi:HlyD family type I secretion periplasmic adaptor subunit [Pseudomonas citronellolis]|uniref:HlyD family type I secretion periplasmic adaptor subunit n=1 Tax=Pseudomonas citronellolis TaxID=53408 RepID=UPI0007187AA7|nr:HlyD family type I secretion periplasmic adaptor subunit [Pseudomonas citronellolis]KRV63818.1 hemolysin secretion protein D [Pseudomonas citronellolis]KRW76938.1 hemolysin secretion protein D [Pseudomonas citronellolis]
MSAQRELLRRYRRVWSQAWRNRKAMDAPTRLPHELQFLPAALSIQELPVNPIARYIKWSIMVFSALALLWACIGEIDVVATAQGKIVPSGKSKVIQPSEVAVVKAINVYDGQQVKAGDLLVELDASQTGADVERLKSDLLAARVDSARAGALLEAIRGDQEPRLGAAQLVGASEEQLHSAEQWLRGQYLELRTNVEQSQAVVEQRTAEIQASQATVESLRRTLPIAEQLAADYKRLLERNFVAKHAWLEKEQSRLDQERELAVQQARLIELKASRREAEQRRESIIAQTRRAMLDLQHESDQKVAALKQELIKAEERDRLTRLISPVDGTVQQLAIHTNGGVVTEAQPLMVVVPKNQPVEVEAMLENKDIGFVRPGQDVEIKVETFTFTKYGVVHGKVVSISDDAIEDERRGLLYGMRVQLLQSYIRVGDEDISLVPGMVVSAEIKTDRRKIVDYFLSPLKVYIGESLLER